MWIEPTGQQLAEPKPCVICGEWIGVGEPRFQVFNHGDFAGPACADCACTTTDEMRSRMQSQLDKHRPTWSGELVYYYEQMIRDDCYGLVVKRPL